MAHFLVISIRIQYSYFFSLNSSPSIIGNMKPNSDSEPQNHDPQFHFVAEKAGMASMDREKVNKIVAEASRDSEFYKRQLEKKIRNDEKIAQMKEKLETYKNDPQIMEAAQQIVSKKIAQFEKERRMDRTWVYFDMDMFYAAVEIRDRPELQDKPVAVGGMAMISTANYIARKYGVRSAMPGFIAKKLCPDLVLIDHNFKKYKETSDLFKSFLVKYDPEYESMGLDEANLDITDYLKRENITDPDKIFELCDSLRLEINAATRVTVSGGIGPNKMLAKMCSEMNKPNGLFMLKNTREEVLEFLANKNIRKIPFIGNTTEQLLRGLGIETCADILNRLVDIHLVFTENAFDFLATSALGISRCVHEVREERKSMSVSRTFKAIAKQVDMEKKIAELAEMLADDLQDEKKLTKHLTLIIKTAKFKQTQKAIMLDRYVGDKDNIANFCIKLLREQWPVEPVRLLGISAKNLINERDYSSAIEKYFKPVTKKKLDDANGLKEENLPRSLENIDEILESEDRSIREILKGEPKPSRKAKADENQNPNEQMDEENFSDIDFGEIEENFSNENDQMMVHEETSRKEPLQNEAARFEDEKTKDSFKSEEASCPLCGLRFEFGWNSTRINNHIDRCLQGIHEDPPSGTPRKDQRISGGTKAASTTSRKAEDPTSKSKKVQKAPDTKTLKIDAFLFKK